MEVKGGQNRTGFRYAANFTPLSGWLPQHSIQERNNIQHNSRINRITTSNNRTIKVFLLLNGIATDDVLVQQRLATLRPQGKRLNSFLHQLHFGMPRVTSGAC